MEMDTLPLNPRPTTPTTCKYVHMRRILQVMLTGYLIASSRRSSLTLPISTSTKLKRRSIAFFNKLEVPGYPAMVEAMAMPRMASAAPMASFS